MRGILLLAILLPFGGISPNAAESALDAQLSQLLTKAGFTGRIESTLEARLGRPVDHRLAGLGRDLFFDSIQSLHDDNSCAGCHSPSNGFGDTQSIAIGVDNDGRVGPNRAGPRNQRRAPMVVNSAFFPRLMWNGRFSASSGDPFDSSRGFAFQPRRGMMKPSHFGPEVRHLLAAQAHIPQTELFEMAGFTGTADGHGPALSLPDGSGIRDAVVARLNASPGYRDRFAAAFPEVAIGGSIRFPMVAQALAELQISLTFADAPIDRFARGERNAMTESQKRGAVLFFGPAGCVGCHAVAGASNEMFSDFENHVLGVPQVAPVIGRRTGNVVFDGPGEDEDFGREQVSGNPADRYAFRTSPLRNVALQPAFFHNGAFTRLEDAVVHHLNVVASAKGYDPAAARVDPDLALRRGPIQPVLDRLDPRVAKPAALSPREVEDLVAFVRDGLLDPDARPEKLCALVPKSLPSGRAVADFEDCR